MEQFGVTSSIQEKVPVTAIEEWIDTEWEPLISLKFLGD